MTRPPPAMIHDFVTDADVPAPPGRAACRCTLHSRRMFTGLLAGAGLAAALPAAAQIPECKRSFAANLAPAETIESQARLQYQQMLQKAGEGRALAPAQHPQLQRLRYIAERMIPFAPACNPRSRDWKWEVNLIGSKQINAFCMPGGKIAFFYGILAELQLDDDEVAVIMGHEAAHALLEHAREQLGKNVATSGVLRLGAALLGLGQVGDMGAQMLAQFASLKFSRDDETQADRLGLLMAAQAGYDPRKGVSLWRKMTSTRRGAPPEMLSTHPAGPTRIRDIEEKLPSVMPVWEQAGKPARRFGPPPASGK